MTKARVQLGVNIDHVATVRQARGTDYPRPAEIVPLAEAGGADSITVHLREDRRHIQDADLSAIQATMQTHMNLECAVTDAMLDIAIRHRPADCCLVPEKREELTTEGGLDVAAQMPRVRDACARLAAAGIRVSLFIDPEEKQLDAAAEVGAAVVELHTGTYADTVEPAAELARLQQAAQYGQEQGLIVHAGHGLHYGNVQAIAAIPELRELNIGHAIVSRALFVGMEQAVRTMRELITAVDTP